MFSPTRLPLLILLAVFFVSTAFGQRQDFGPRKHAIGTTLFVLGTPLFDPSPKYYQLNYSCALTPKDVLSIEAITWTYYGPKGRPYGPSYEDAASDFPGRVRAVGAGLAYKRFLWRGVYGQVHSTAFRKDYLDRDGKRLQSGFELFNTVRLGYHLSLFRGRVFLEPSIAMTFWPVSTNLPASFRVEEEKWRSYFVGEPGLHVGFMF